MKADPSLTTWRVLWRSMAVAIFALVIAWSVGHPAPAGPLTPPNDRIVVPPVPPVPTAKPGVR